MKFLVDECTGPAVARCLRDHGHDVFSIYEEARGLDDESILKKAVEEQRIVVTNDTDFGKLVFHETQVHTGVILLRLEDNRSANKIFVLQQLLSQYANQLEQHFVVASETNVRITNPNSH